MNQALAKKNLGDTPAVRMLLPVNIVAPFVESLASQVIADDPGRDVEIPVASLTALVSEQIDRSPFYVAVAFAVLTRLFNLTPMFRWGRPFSRLSSQKRLQHIDRWRRSRLKILRDFVSFYQSFVILGIHENYGADDSHSQVGA